MGASPKRCLGRRTNQVYWLALAGLIVFFSYLLFGEGIIGYDRERPMVVDTQGVLGSLQIKELKSNAQAIYKRTQVRVVVLITSGPDKAQPEVTTPLLRGTASGVWPRSYGFYAHTVLLNYWMFRPGEYRLAALTDLDYVSISDLSTLPGLRPIRSNSFAQNIRSVQNEIYGHVKRQIQRRTLWGRLLPAPIASLLPAILLASAFVWVLAISIRFMDGRNAGPLALSVETLVAYLLFWAFTKIALYISGWPEASKIIDFAHLPFANLVALTLCLGISRRVPGPRLLPVMSVFFLFCLAGSLLGIQQLPHVSGWRGSLLFQATMSPLLSFCAIPIFALIRGWMFFVGDDGTGLLGDLAQRVSYLDRSCCIRAGKPIPPPEPLAGHAQRFRQAVLESSFAYVFWLSLPVLCWWFEERIRTWAAGPSGQSRWLPDPVIHTLRFLRLAGSCLPESEAQFDAGKAKTAIVTAEEGLALLRSLSTRCPWAPETMWAYRLYMVLAAAYCATEQYDLARQFLNRATGVADRLFFGLSIRPLLQCGRLSFMRGDYGPALRVFREAQTVMNRLIREFAVPMDGMNDIEKFRFLRNTRLITPAFDSIGFAVSAIDAIEIIARSQVTLREASYMESLCLDELARARGGASRKQFADEAASARNRAWNTPILLVRDQMTPGREWVRKLADRLVSPEIEHRTGYSEAVRRIYDGCVGDDVHQELASCLTQSQLELPELDPSEQGPGADELEMVLGRFQSLLVSEDASERTLACIAALRRYPLNDDLWKLLDSQPDAAPVARGFSENNLLNLTALEPVRDAQIILARSPRTKEVLAVYAWLARNEGVRLIPFARTSAFRLLRLALDLYRDQGDLCGFADTCLCLAELALANGNHHSAGALSNWAKSFAAILGQVALLQRALAFRGRLCRALGALDMALASLDEALELAEETRGAIGNLDQRTLYTATRVDIYAEAVRVALARNEPRRALECAERAKSRTFVEMLGNHRLDIRNSTEQQLLDKERSLQQELRELCSVESPAGRVDSGPANDRKARREAVRSQLREVKQQIRETSAEWASLQAVPRLALHRPEDWCAFRTLLFEFLNCGEDRVAVIEYFLAAEGSVAFLIAPWLADEELTVVEIPLTPDEASSMARLRSRRVMDQQTGAGSRIQAPMPEPPDAYRRLVGPLLPWLRRVSATGLLFVPHGDLHLFPFHALSRTERGERRFLVEDYPCSYLPALSLLPHLIHKRSDRIGSALVVGNPNPPGDLPGSEQEAIAVAQTLGVRPVLREMATREEILATAPLYEVVHLACHAELVADDPLQSALILADGPLQLDEVLELSLRASLVALSACDTARGLLYRGDELIAMSRAWIYAGTPSVIATLWPAPDQVSAELMVSFYRGWRQTGTSRMHALQLAQVAFLREQRECIRRETAPGSLEEQARLLVDLEPSRWAHLVLIGDPS